MRYWTALALSLLTFPTAAQQTIVGRWAADRPSCRQPSEVFTIRSMAIDGGMLSCAFDSVVRRGHTVVWTGLCVAENSWQGTFVASEEDGQLTIDLGRGKSLGPLVRCGR